MRLAPPKMWPGLRALVARYEPSSAAKSIFQLFTSIGLFVATCVAMYLLGHVSYLLALALTLPAAGFLVRVFIVQHDCGHGAFFRSRWANDLVGTVCGVMTFTPYAHWRRHHNCHHGNWNNLDRREAGADIYASCLTVAEYQALKPRARLVYRALRHPIVAQVILPPFIFLVLYRFPFDTPKSWTRERHAVLVNNLAIVGLFGGLMLLVGVGPVLLVQLPIIALASIIGVWLFALQHRFDRSAWTRQDGWNLADASIIGTSHLKLPRVLQWFTGNIGFHHVHHLNPRVPNYRLEACHDGIPALHAVRTLTWRDGVRALSYVLWDEVAQRMVNFAEVPSR